MLAYLDAASGSLIVQAIVAGAAGAAVFFKLGWRRITGPFRRRPAAEVGEDVCGRQWSARRREGGQDLAFQRAGGTP